MTTARPFDLVVFDFDGTLVDSHPGIVAAMNGALVAVGAPPRSADAIAPHIGRPLLDVIREVLPPGSSDDVVEQVRLAYRPLYFELAPALTRLFPGMRAGLDGLKASGARLAVASNKSRRGLEQMIRHLELDDVFDAVVAADDVPSPKPHPAMLHALLLQFPTALERVVMVGDARADIGLGNAAGVATIGVTWGAHDEATLRREGASFVVDTVQALFARLSGTAPR